MCRIYAHIAPTAVSACDLLVDSKKSLLAQSRAKGREQKDGWGIGYVSPKRSALSPKIYKSPGAMYREIAKLKKAAGVAAPVVIGHIRAASNPRKLPKRVMIGMANTQPFTDGTLVFAHNGTVNVPDAVVKRLGALRGSVKGLNDSEAYFWQFMKFYRKSGKVAQALENCLKELKGLSARPHHGLNTVISDGSKLYAFCHYPSKAKALLSRRPWGRMVYAVRKDRVVVASEPLDGGKWKDLREGQLLEADGSGKIRKRMLKLAC